jgi:hypothetical protein
MLEKARAYETRLSSLKVDARRLFPMEIKGFPTATATLLEKFKNDPRSKEKIIEDELKRGR